MMPIKISFILPMYNVENFLEKCVNSLLNQKLVQGAFEIILVNDGSRDGTLEVAHALAKNWPEIKIISQENGGQAVARNAGLKVASGEYIWFIDSDDFILAEVVPKLLRIADESHADVVTFEVCKVPAGVVPSVKFDPYLVPEPIRNGIDYVARHNYNNGPWLFMVRKSFLQEIGLTYKEGRQCEDGMFTMEMLCRAQRITHYPSPAYVYVKHSGGITKNREPKIYQWWLEGFAYAIDFFNGFIATQAQRADANSAFLQRLKSRRDSYTLFYCLRLMQSTQKIGEILSTHRNLKKKNWIPLRYLSLTEYPGAKFRFLRYVVSHAWTFIAAVLAIKVFTPFRRR